MDKTKLITALRESAAALRGGCEYDWYCSASCNCGILAKHLLGKEIGGIGSWGDAATGRWGGTCHVPVCSRTGMPLDQVFSMLDELSLSREDVADLEHLTNKEVVARMGREVGFLGYAIRENVILYMEAWADILEEEQEVYNLTQGVPGSEQPVATLRGSGKAIGSPSEEPSPLRIANATLV